MSYDQDIAAGLAERISWAHIARWSPDAVYAATSVVPAIFIRDIPDMTACPVVTISPYPVTEEWLPLVEECGRWGVRDSILGVQVRTRGLPRDHQTVDDLDESICHALHGLMSVSIGGHQVSQVAWKSGAMLGKDENERWIRSSNYYIHGPR